MEMGLKQLKKQIRLIWILKMRRSTFLIQLQGCDLNVQSVGILSNTVKGVFFVGFVDIQNVADFTEKMRNSILELCFFSNNYPE